VSASGVRKGRHIIDPREGKPAEHALAAWSCAPSAAVADALSTAFMVMAPWEIARYCAGHASAGAIVLVDGQNARLGQARVLRYGQLREDSGLKD
jgi:thiamine biosynthesis lipoprotein